MSLNIVEQGERISLRESWSSLGVANGKSIKSSCTYGWVETNTPFSSCFMFYSSDKYFHTMCNALGAMIECLCLWLSFTMFEQLLEMHILLCKLLYLHGLQLT